MDLRREGGDIIARVKIAGDRIVVTDYGKPQAAIVSLVDLAALESGSFAKYDSLDAVSIKAENLGSDFDDFLREEGIYDEVKEKSRKKIAAWLISNKKTNSRKVKPRTRMVKTKATKAVDATAIMLAKKYIEHCLKSGGKVEILEFASEMRIKEAAARKLLLAAQTGMGERKLF